MIVGLFFISLSLMAIMGPIIQTIFGYPNGEYFYLTLSPICHQYPTRSLWIFNRPFALCSRCFSGYLGLGFGFLLIYSQHKYFKRLIIGIALLIPGVLDGVIQLTSIYESTNIIRFFTGLSGGFGIFYITFPINSMIKKQKEK
ncbi:MAG: DUF2085 domain-containing protein [Candidatus Marinimicrobia bacterium]|jgi:uncharacterized membrane protein|nr:DUF2085 domain-containing protein [Candidatus Neomarinimicrobiota bacterium]MBT5364056.1 DUF2085 domain-containing protein [Candidatus Neomarinimicrobiota bacterium]MBT5461737.1 DUF2085 domain-containing protein [Candidatus Neomarinimicrobiota bacterium]MBT5758308.1 DUF2085 domain-containing protein [Candidatus Neomarinimicrobiota bacterium]MBT7113513.1 DUF2085 domain-containing protein [Candidatus Neomarinimicrobiota bacterium]